MATPTSRDQTLVAFRVIGCALAQVYDAARTVAPSHLGDNRRHEVGIAAVNAYGRTLGLSEGARVFMEGVIQLIDTKEDDHAD